MNSGDISAGMFEKKKKDENGCGVPHENTHTKESSERKIKRVQLSQQKSCLGIKSLVYFNIGQSKGCLFFFPITLG